VLRSYLFSETPQETIYLDSIDPYRYNTVETNAVVTQMKMDLYQLKTTIMQRKTNTFLLWRPLPAPLVYLVMRVVLTYPIKSIPLRVTVKFPSLTLIPRDMMEEQLHSLAASLAARDNLSYTDLSGLALPSIHDKQAMPTSMQNSSRLQLEHVLLVNPVDLTRSMNTLQVKKDEVLPLPVSLESNQRDAQMDSEDKDGNDIFPILGNLALPFSAEGGIEDANDDTETACLFLMEEWARREERSAWQEFIHRSAGFMQSAWQHLQSFGSAICDRLSSLFRFF
jgi:hypothetical protein